MSEPDLPEDPFERQTYTDLLKLVVAAVTSALDGQHITEEISEKVENLNQEDSTWLLLVVCDILAQTISVNYDEPAAIVASFLDNILDDVRRDGEPF